MVYLDARYAQLALASPVIVQRAAAEGVEVDATRVVDLRERPTFVFASEPDTNNPMVTVSRVELVPQLNSTTRPDELSFHFAFVDAGKVTLVNKVDLTAVGSSVFPAVSPSLAWSRHLRTP